MRSLRKTVVAALLMSLLLTACAAPVTPQNTTPPTGAPTQAPTKAPTQAPTQEPTDPPFDFPEFTEPTGDILYNTNWDGKTLKILAIGNSFSVDAMTYLYDIAKAHGVKNVVLGNLYVAGCSLSKHISIGASGKGEYKYYKNTDGKWKTTSNVSMQTAIEDEDWNIISMQQASSQSGVPSSYDRLDDLQKLLAGFTDMSKITTVWHMTWAYHSTSTNNAFIAFNSDQLAMYRGIADAVQAKVVKEHGFNIVMATGTAIQTARAFFGDELNRDTSHLNELGQFIAGYTWFVALTGAPVEELKFIPDELALTDAEEEAILHAVNEALFYPFQVS